MTDSIPARPEEISPDWLTGRLRASGAITRASVASLDCEEISEGMGFAGVVARLTPTYTEPETGAPTTLIAKMASNHDPTRDLLTELGSYQREINFYDKLGSDAGLPAPVCHHAAIDADSGSFVLLLEDLAPGRPADQIVGASREQSVFVMHELARFHARWWNDPTLLAADWVHPPRLGDRLSALFDAGLEQVGDRLRTNAPRLHSLAERLQPMIPLFGRLVDAEPVPSPFTLVHGDMRSDNLFFPSAEGGRFAVVDWQGTTLASPVVDVSAWIILSTRTEDRRASETDLLRTYHAALRAQGVRGYSLTRLRLEHWLALLQIPIVVVLVAGQLDFSSPRGRALYDALTTRLDASLADHRVDRLLPLVPLLVRARLRRLGRASRSGRSPRASTG